MTDELEQLAAQGRTQAEARSQQDKGATSSRAKHARSREDESRIRQALAAGTRGPQVFMLAMIAVLFVGAMAVMLASDFASSRFFPAVGAAFVLIVGLVLVGGMQVLQGHFARRERAWLDALPFAFDREHYFDGLAGKRFESQPRLRITFATPLDESAQALVLDAARAGAVERGEWEQDVLVLDGPKLETQFTGGTSNQRKSVHSNGPVHLWFRGFVARQLMVVHGRHPVERLVCEIR